MITKTNNMEKENSLKDNIKNILAIKVPANVKNINKAIDNLGGKRNIINKNLKNENLDLKLFIKNIPLEKNACNDLLLRKKIKRNKKNPNEIKIEYQIIGQINQIYQCSCLTDFFYSNILIVLIIITAIISCLIITYTKF